MTPEFKCPKCGHFVVEEVMGDVTVASEVVDVDEDGDVSYGEQTNEDGEVVRYQCAECGWTLPVDDGQELYEFLKNQKKEE